ncbi:molybdenum cofactor sulfurase [Thraustotheca clavata]|uniref:Molybdenum cofactor sulfurase n=1 Tax=Thraustotheca clavata TaxID=74557 RepID=A0A1V9ZCH3_9STRA|nr:molybdenum cofactor sulfurase [Thraustotheca clavata]
MMTEIGYGTTAEGDDILMKLRQEEFPHMKGHVYLDHAGATLYSSKQLQLYQEQMLGNLYGNPHSMGAASSVNSASAITCFKEQLAAFFHTTFETYHIVLTSGATAGLKLVAESFPFTNESSFVYSIDSHTSVVGIRSFANAVGATIATISPNELDEMTPTKDIHTDCDVYNLFAFPGECNFSGAKHDLSIIQTVQNQSLDAATLNVLTPSKAKPSTGRWLVLLDAAKLAATNSVDLSKNQPDFMVLSFYKLFGFPTGMGALFVKKSISHLLKKSYFGGGTVASSFSSILLTIPRTEFERQFEDGTVSFLSVLACQHGLEQLQRFGMTAIERHVNALSSYLYNQLISLKHVNGMKVCQVYGKHHGAGIHGSIVACNFIRLDGSVVGYTEVSALSSLQQIHLRTGCFCNPGACQYYLGLSNNDILSHMKLGHTCGDAMDIIDGKPTGAIRLSLGYMTTKDEIDIFIDFIKTYFVSKAIPNEPCPKKSSPSKLELCKITLFPIKSCGGMSVSQWTLGPRGLLYDREWAIVNPSTGRAWRQKDLPAMTRIYPSIDLLQQELVVTTTLTKCTPLRLPLSYVPSSTHQLTVCAKSCNGSKYDNTVAVWFTNALGRPCTLMRVTSESFVNEAPYLLLSRGSVRDMNARMDVPVSEDVFRANLIVDGCFPHEEDTWKKICIGKASFDVIGPCSRCTMVNIDPSTGVFSPAPLKTLASYRREKARIFFGQFLSRQYDEFARISINDQVISE